jgi:hypothetical protein
MDKIIENYIMRALGDWTREYQRANEVAANTKRKFTTESRRCPHRHATALYSNCLHPNADADMPNCLIDECPLKEGV